MRRTAAAKPRRSTPPTPNTAKRASSRTGKQTLAWQSQQQRSAHHATRIHKHRVAIAGGHLHDVRRRGQLLRRASLCRIAQAQLPVAVVPRRPRLQSRTQTQQSSSTTLMSTEMRRADEAHCSCQAAQLSSSTPNTAKRASAYEKADARMAEPATTEHAPRRFHPQTPGGYRRRTPARRSSASPAAPACFGLSYRPGPAAPSCCCPSPTPAIAHITAAQQQQDNAHEHGDSDAQGG
jgi:hypothetical protein